MKVATLKNPPKKKAKWPWVLLIIFLVVVIGPILTFYILFYDPSTKRVKLQDDVSLVNIGNRIIVDSLDPAPTNGKMAIVVTENDIDNILHIAMSKITEKVKFITKAYMNANGGNYTFYLDLDGVVIKSRLRVITKLSLSEDGKNFLFNIKGIGLGRVDGFKTPATWIIDRFFTEDKINEILSQTGLSLSFSRELFAIVYPKTALIQDLAKLTTSEDLGLYFNVVKTLLEDDLMEFNFQSNNFVEGVVDLQPLQTNELVTDDAEHIKIQPEQVGQIRDKVVALINTDVIDPTVKLLPNYAFDFLFSGWENLSDEGKNALNDIDFSTVGILDKTTYTGIVSHESEATLYTKMQETVDAGKLMNKTLDPRYTKLCTLTEQDINDYISARSIVGYTSLLHRETPTGHKVNYITVENFYMNFYSAGDTNIAEMVCKVDVNGYNTSLTLNTQMPESGFTNSKLDFVVQDVRFGTSNAENIKDDFFNVVCDAINGGNDNSLVADKETYTISIDFTGIMNYAREQVESAIESTTGTHHDLADQFSMDNVTFNISGTSREDASSMQLNLINPIDY